MANPKPLPMLGSGLATKHSQDPAATLLLEIATGIQNKFSKMYRPQGKLFYFPLNRKCNLEVKAKKYVTERS